MAVNRAFPFDMDVNTAYPAMLMLKNPSRSKIATSHNPHVKQQFSVSVFTSFNEMREIDEWVDVTFGRSTSKWYNPRWSKAAYGKWNFKNQSDVTMFILRWS